MGSTTWKSINIWQDMLTSLKQQNAQLFSFDIYRIITLYIPTCFSPQEITIREIISNNNA